MSDSVTSFIPADPNFRVSDEALAEIENHLASRYSGSTEIQLNRAHEKPFFIDAGNNHESIKCPKCGSEVPTDEWQAAMSSCWVDASQGFDLLPSTLSCCGASVSPDALNYTPHQGFAMASFEITNPSTTEHLPTLDFLASLLKIDFRIVNAHY